MSKALVITEKPSVARDIVAVLGGFTEHDGYWENDELVVTFAVGHLFELLEPQEIDEKYKAWTLDVLPIIPDAFALKKKKGHSDRIRTIKKLLERDDVDRIVNACDAGREGELIFREIVRYFDSQKPIQRLWLQSMTTGAIRQGFQQLRPGEELEGLAAAAECRAQADWLIGMNATRALTKRLKSRKERTAWSAGRVQTPTLALLVEREHEVLAHEPKPYWRVLAGFEHEAQSWQGTWYDPDFRSGDDDGARDDRIFEKARAEAIVAAATGSAGVAEETRKPSREAPPPLFDLTSLQREGNRRFGWSARRTLGAAQRCYEAHKLLTYPRTDSRCLPNDYRATVNDVLSAYAGAGADGLVGELGGHAQRLLDRGLENEARIFDDSGVSDHFAIIPTGTMPSDSLSGDDQRVFELVFRRFLGAFHPPALWERVERVVVVSDHRFRTRARALVEAGWREVLPKSGEDEEAVVLPALVADSTDASGVEVATREVELTEEETKPPPRLSEARLLTLMENAGKYVDDEDIAAVLHERGLGTPATRAETIENLIAKGYVVRVGKALRPTVKGIRLIDTLQRVHIGRLASAELTGELEQHLAQVEDGERSADDFIGEIKDYAREIVQVAKTFEYDELYEKEEPLGTCPKCGRPVVEQVWFYGCVDPQETKVEDRCPIKFWKDTSGRYMDRETVRKLLRDGQTGVIDGFTARNGRTYRGHLEIDRDEWKVVTRPAGWNEEGASDQPEYEVNTEPLGRCPICDEHDVVETPLQYICVSRLKEQEAAARAKAAGEKRKREKACGFVMPRTVCKREITRVEAQHYMQNGKTELLEDFTSRFGRPFSATLVLKENGRHGFEFPPRKPRGGAATADAGEEAAAKAPARKTGKTTKKKKKTTGKKTTRKKTTGTPRKKAATRKKAGAARKKASAGAGAKKAGAARKKSSARSAPTDAAQKNPQTKSPRK